MLELALRLSLPAFCAGVVLAQLGRPPSPTGPGEPAYWVADRDAAALIALDADLFVVAHTPWPWPVALEPAPGGLWVACAPRGDPGGGHRLSRVELREGVSQAVELASWDLGRVIDLEAAPDGGVAWLEERDGRALLARVDGGGSLRSTGAPPGSVRVAVGPRGFLVGTAAGRVWSFDGEWEPGPVLGQAVLDLVPAGRGDWWVLAREDARLVVVLLGPSLGRGLRVRLRTHLSTQPGASGGILALVAGSAQVAADAADPEAWSVFRDGRVGDGGSLYLRGVSSAVETSEGGVVYALPGALIRKGPAGQARPGQGGFDRLVDVARATPCGAGKAATP